MADIDKVEELRNDLRARRNSVGDDTTFSGPYGAGLQAQFGSNRQISRASGGSDTSSGSPDTGVGRGGRSDRRSSSDHSSIYDGTTNYSPGTRGRKRIKRDDDVPVREYAPPPYSPIEGQQFKRPRGRPPKALQATVQAIDTTEHKIELAAKSLFTGKHALSVKEANDLREPLNAALPDWFEYLDKLIWHQSKDETRKPIWSDMDAQELETISKILLKQGQKHAAIAEIARTAVDATDFINVGIVVIPRTVETLNKLTERQRAERMQRNALRARQQSLQHHA